MWRATEPLRFSGETEKPKLRRSDPIKEKNHTTEDKKKDMARGRKGESNPLNKRKSSRDSQKRKQKKHHINR